MSQRTVPQVEDIQAEPTADGGVRLTFVCDSDIVTVDLHDWAVGHLLTLIDEAMDEGDE